MPASAHPVPFSYLDLKLDGQVLEGTLTVHQYDLAHDLRIGDPAAVEDANFLKGHEREIAALFGGRLHLTGERPLHLSWTGIRPMPERNSIQLTFSAIGPINGKVTYAGNMFPYDPQHETFVNVYEHGTLRTQWIVGAKSPPYAYYSGSGQGVIAVLETFIPAGAHHIWIGPDHLLFLLGLLLFGGTWRRLLWIVTAFTIGHSITLSLAALDIVTPPASIIEPAIALTIIVVGVSNLLRGEERDPRILLAGTFGLIHGFGFASVLKEFGLPRDALGWSLFGFNFGVELGQLTIVVPLALILGTLWRTRPKLARQIAIAGSVVVIAGGTYWFLQRTVFAGGFL